ncbi:GNAT family N-acetyltransferase [Proteus hauseri]|uniref:GNAT family N-acetyltransferase n=1 Tax=Proteus hauseri TaxID=183417 RepID=UPI001009472C|nr:GNAT family protein [Proteus hauseri]QAV24385.1 N-acetyltransferase [Proteus hauseri]
MKKKNFTFEHITANDWLFFHNLYISQNVMKYISGVMTEEQIKEAFESRLPIWNIHSTHWLCMVIRNEKKSQMGLIGLKIVESQAEEQGITAEVGFIIEPQYAGQGLATKALMSMLVDERFKLITRFIAVVTAGNLASEQVLKKSGFTFKDITKENYSINNVLYDDHNYELLR